MTRQDNSYDALELDRDRWLKLGYVATGVPTSVLHKENLDAKKHGAQRRGANSTPSLTTDDEDDERVDDSYPPEGNARGQSKQQRPRTNKSASDSRALPSRTMTNQQPQRRMLLTDEPKLKMNQIEAELIFPGGKEWKGVFLLDTGVIDNWINEKIVSANNLPAKWEKSKPRWYSFDNSPVASLGLLKGSTVFENHTQPCEFQIARQNSQFDVILGCRSLMERGLVIWKGKDLDVLAPLTSRSKDSKEEKEAHRKDDRDVERRGKQLDELVKWRNERKKEGLQWDKVKNEWYKDDGGNKVPYDGPAYVLDLGY
ncbi:hypothetical protein AYO21_08295 [Fonsecaea monophora]|uniref:Uncharacterized protein n=1 Tax=Fonsecaea monophora TaxID=254056 RepID=A0A177F1G6_9EURO|nr:hypothetical protein AYO21_08295 [Fonsecaea monophora]KAH0843905.1 hypothetical protein FOPE_08954 [Fonsecaea pedrosoi]OAG37441.1 hypothetical protein AYO21_08295 [Fonsecaea monophora]